jgi:hypothetical protein
MFVHSTPEIHSVSYKNEPQITEDSETYSKSKNRKNKNWTKNTKKLNKNRQKQVISGQNNGGARPKIIFWVLGCGVKFYPFENR